MITTINDLPDDMITTIFQMTLNGNVDEIPSIRFRLVCRNWQRVYDSNYRLVPIVYWASDGALHYISYNYSRLKRLVNHNIKMTHPMNNGHKSTYYLYQYDNTMRLYPSFSRGDTRVVRPKNERWYVKVVASYFGEFLGDFSLVPISDKRDTNDVLTKYYPAYWI